mgnify:CR=1 FL=1
MSNIFKSSIGAKVVDVIEPAASLVRPGSKALGGLQQIRRAARAGEACVPQPPFDLHAAFVDSSVTLPLIFILVSGADPVKGLITYAEQCGMGEELESRMGSPFIVRAPDVSELSSEEVPLYNIYWIMA